MAFFSFYIYFSLYIFFIYFLCLPFSFLSRGKHKCHVRQGETHYFRKEWTTETKKITKEIQEKNVRFCGIALLLLLFFFGLKVVVVTVYSVNKEE